MADEKTSTSMLSPNEGRHVPRFDGRPWPKDNAGKDKPYAVSLEGPDEGRFYRKRLKDEDLRHATEDDVAQAKANDDKVEADAKKAAAAAKKAAANQTKGEGDKQ